VVRPAGLSTSRLPDRRNSRV